MSRGPKVLMVSWKDMRHPRRGGAEIYTRTVLDGLSELGYEVTWFAPASNGHGRQEVTPSGVMIYRYGNLPMHVLRSVVHLARHRDRYDLVIDQINTIPMMMRAVVPRRKGVVLMHQLAAEVWHQELPQPLAGIGRILEPLYLKWYRSWPAIVVSASTREDLQRLGFREVYVVENSLTFDLPEYAPRTRPEIPHFVGLGRLVRMKRFEHLLQAFVLVRRSLENAQLTIIGRGDDDYARNLKRRASEIPGAQVLQDISDIDKQRVLRQATAVVATSIREGWGLMVTEGHAFGTPSIAYRVPGLKDSTRHGIDGLLVPEEPEALAAAMISLHRDAEQWTAFSRAARKRAEVMVPARQSRAMHTVLQSILQSRSRRRGRARLQ